MTDHVRVRLISLIEDSGNSLEQLETLTNRFLGSITQESVQEVQMKTVAREVMDEEGQLMRETDHVMFIHYHSSDPASSDNADGNANTDAHAGTDTDTDNNAEKQ
ncbi:MAG: hypothetical protein HRU15_03520 [Planctomycetes bacterium]|nr:hypothetical protein [Planctomycetota bacterium]